MWADGGRLFLVVTRYGPWPGPSQGAVLYEGLTCIVSSVCLAPCRVPCPISLALFLAVSLALLFEELPQ